MMTRKKKREEVKKESKLDLLLALQAQADPPLTFPETHKHRNHHLPQESPQLSQASFISLCATISQCTDAPAAFCTH